MNHCIACYLQIPIFSNCYRKGFSNGMILFFTYICSSFFGNRDGLILSDSDGKVFSHINSEVFGNFRNFIFHYCFKPRPLFVYFKNGSYLMSET